MYCTDYPPIPVPLALAPCFLVTLGVRSLWICTVLKYRTDVFHAKRLECPDRVCWSALRDRRRVPRSNFMTHNIIF